MEIITAEESRKKMLFNTEDKITVFNQLVESQEEHDDQFDVRLPFDRFGSKLEDVQFVIDAGYLVERSQVNPYWYVSLPLVPGQDEYELHLDTNIPKAEEIKKLLPDIETKKLAHFKNLLMDAVMNVRNKEFAFMIDHTSVIGGKYDDVAFIEALGYTVERYPSYWRITLP